MKALTNYSSMCPGFADQPLHSRVMGKSVSHHLPPSTWLSLLLPSSNASRADTVFLCGNPLGTRKRWTEGAERVLVPPYSHLHLVVRGVFTKMPCSTEVHIILPLII
jgi:hypothetical protein